MPSQQTLNFNSFGELDVFSEMESSEHTALKGLEHVEIHKFTGIHNMAKIVHSQADKVQAGGFQQWLVFRSVTINDLTKFDHKHHLIGKFVRMTHHTNLDLLIMKLMPGAIHEEAHATFGNRIFSRAILMGLPEDALIAVNGTKYRGPMSSKEGDTGYKPNTRRYRRAYVVYGLMHAGGLLIQVIK